MIDDKPKIFLSYAHEDIGIAKKIYSDLKRFNLDIWFDNESLLGGQNWKFEINKAIKNSTKFIALLSKESIDKVGYVQKELKIALEMLDNHPLSKTYILPVRIEDCEPMDERLSDLHWIDVFPERNYEKGIHKILRIVSPEITLLRHNPLNLSVTDVIDLIKKYNFFDKNRNERGYFLHQYKIQTIKGNTVVIDHVSGLMWQRDGSSASMEWKMTKKYIKELNRNEYASYVGWRLPTLEEVMSLMEPEKNGDYHIDPVFNETQNWIWTADRVKDKPREKSWVVNFYGGSCYDMVDSWHYVRAVRICQSSK